MTFELNGKVLTIEFSDAEVPIINFITQRHGQDAFVVHLAKLLENRKTQMNHENDVKILEKLKKNPTLYNQLLEK